MVLQLKTSGQYINSVAALGISLALPTMFASSCMAATPKSTNSDLLEKINFNNLNLDNAIQNHNYQLIATAPPVSSATINLVKRFEGFRSYAYIDTSGLPVIGYGQSRINGRRVYMGQYISQAQADAELERELYHIQRLVISKVRVKLNPNQLGALTSLVYNSGVRILTHSTLIRKLNTGNYAGAANEFLRWNKANQGGRLVPLLGLTRRRQAERQLFLTPYR